VARIQDLGIGVSGGQTDSDEVSAIHRVPEPLPPGLTREEEAVLIAERLSALVESRRRDVEPARPDPAPAPSVAAPAAAAAAASRGIVGARHSGRLLGNLLVTRGYIVESELRYALARQSTTGGPIGQILVDLGLITDRDLVELLAEQLRMQVIDLVRVKCDPALRTRLSKVDARRLAALPLRLVDGHIDVAVADASDEDAVGELMALLGAPLRLFLATRADIDGAIDRLYG
jgi:hypothetical protein